MNITLSQSQQEAYDYIIKNLSKDKIILLEGGAGTGKTTLTKYIADYYNNERNICICAIAPTHKSKRVIDKILNKNNIIPISTFTIASALSKIKEHSYVGTKIYNGSNIKKLTDYRLFIIDEVSMISDSDLNTILMYIKSSNKQALIIGDSNQIPCPSAGYTKINIETKETKETKVTKVTNELETIELETIELETIELETIELETIELETIELETIELETIETKETKETKELKTKHNTQNIQYLEKMDSFIFTDLTITKIKLTDIVRQSLDSPIIKLATFVRDNLLIDFDIKNAPYKDIISYTNNNMYKIFKDYYVNGKHNSCKIIAYTNQAVKTHNLEIRNYLNYNTQYVVGEILMGYTNLGWPELIIENGQDYIITNIEIINNHKISDYILDGKLLNLKIADTSIIVRNLFFININNAQNNEFINTLIRLAEKLNSYNSTKNDYRNYHILKNQVIFIEDIYKYKDKIYTETTFKDSHSLLFTRVNQVIENFNIKKSELSDKINTAYKSILDSRIRDKTKQIGDSELIADKYKVIEKDIYYGYSITSHKSQGSTYNSVIVDEIDFQKMNNRWNFKYNLLESRIKEKNQLRYVSYTRAKENLFIAVD